MDNLLLQWEILWPALLAGLLVLATHVPLGQAVLQRGIIFLDLAIAQIAAFGLVIATTLGIGEHSAHTAWLHHGIAVTAAVSGAMLLYQLRRFSAGTQEALIGILFILAATGSILLLAQDPHGGERLKDMLVGQILWVQVQDLFGIALLYAAIAWCLAGVALVWFVGCFGEPLPDEK